MHIIEEMVLLRDSQPVQHIELDTEKVRRSKTCRPIKILALSHMNQ